MKFQQKRRPSSRQQAQHFCLREASIAPHSVRTALYFLLVTALALSVTAGDYFPYRPRCFTYEFAAPFDSPHAPKLPAAKLTITAQPDEEGRYPLHLGVASLASIEVELGKERLSVPKKHLRDLGRFNLNTLDFYWVGGSYHVALSRVNAIGLQPERVEFIFRDGAFVDLWVANKSQRYKHPTVFEVK